MDLQYFVELFCGGLTRGSIYALIALGYTMVYGIIELINFAHGEIYMIGAFTALIVASALGIMGFPAAGIIVIAALAAVIWCAAYGYTIEKIAYRPLRGAPRLSPLISAIGVSIFLQNYVSLAQTSDFVAFPQLITDFEFLDPISHIIGTSDFLIIVTSLVTMVALTLFIQYTKMGKAMRATAQNRKMAMLLGIDADRIISLTFIIGSSLAAIGGVHILPLLLIQELCLVSRPLRRPCSAASGPSPAPWSAALCSACAKASPPAISPAPTKTPSPSPCWCSSSSSVRRASSESPRFKRSKGADMNMILRALMVSVWFMALTFPLVVLKVDALNDTILFRWENMASIGVGAFVLSIFWRWSMERKARGAVSTGPSLFARALEAVRQPKPRYTCLGLIAVLMLVMPYISSMYQINIMISALIYIMLGLGLNIVVGLAGQLVLGYAAFYAVGAYTYGLLNTYFGLGFWAVLPVGGIMAALFGLMLGFPVLRLKGDYLAIVTLGFGEIIRLVLENWTSVTKGSFGLSNLSRPSLFGMEMGVTEATNYIYYIVLAAVVVTIIVVGRLKNSRIGLALQALREDEIACEAMGIDLTKVKLSAFALGSCWAGFAGVIFAAKTTFINPASFTFMESAMVLSMVVLGGMGSVLGVTIAAAILVLAPEYLRAFSEYRMLLFGAVMVIMMIYRPQGLISGEKRTYKITNKDKIDSSKSAFDVPATGGQA